MVFAIHQFVNKHPLIPLPIFDGLLLGLVIGILGRASARMVGGDKWPPTVVSMFNAVWVCLIGTMAVVSISLICGDYSDPWYHWTAYQLIGASVSVFIFWPYLTAPEVQAWEMIKKAMQTAEVPDMTQPTDHPD